MRKFLRVEMVTGDQVSCLHFTAAATARYRLVELTRHQVLARFRRQLEIGSQHWRYTLGPIAATLHAVAHGGAATPPARVAAQHPAVARSPRLEHLIATNEVSVALATTDDAPTPTPAAAPAAAIPEPAPDPTPGPADHAHGPGRWMCWSGSRWSGQPVLRCESLPLGLMVLVVQRDQPQR